MVFNWFDVLLLVIIAITVIIGAIRIFSHSSGTKYLPNYWVFFSYL